LTNVACRAVCTLREHILKRTHSKERAKRSIVKLQAEPFNGLLFDGHALCDSHELLRHATFVRVTKEPSFDPSRTLSTLHELLAQASGPKGARSLSFSLSISLPPGRFVSVSTRGHVACERAVGEMSSSSSSCTAATEALACCTCCTCCTAATEALSVSDFFPSPRPSGQEELLEKWGN